MGNHEWPSVFARSEIEDRSGNRDSPWKDLEGVQSNRTTADEKFPLEGLNPRVELIECHHHSSS
jgi:hypothetical protein